MTQTCKLGHLKDTWPSVTLFALATKQQSLVDICLLQELFLSQFVGLDSVLYDFPDFPFCVFAFFSIANAAIDPQCDVSKQSLIWIHQHMLTCMSVQNNQNRPT